MKHVIKGSDRSPYSLAPQNKDALVSSYTKRYDNMAALPIDILPPKKKAQLFIPGYTKEFINLNRDGTVVGIDKVST
ncbi:unnamed protein product [Rotaria sp. Silwood2]|nr:unnamed protein product [Rotaria sp. Silwood2]CAF4034275.1 unnamed protein product [Rotaria sp. Silwood2]